MEGQAEVDHKKHLKFLRNQSEIQVAVRGGLDCVFMGSQTYAVGTTLVAGNVSVRRSPHVLHQVHYWLSTGNLSSGDNLGSFVVS